MSHNATACHSGSFPPGWVVEPQTDGSVRVLQTDEAKIRASKSWAYIALAWNVAFVIALGTNADKLRAWPMAALLGALLGALLYLLLGIGFIYAFVWGRYSTTEWSATPGALELRTGWRFSSRHKTRRYSEGIWVLRQWGDDEAKDWDLHLKSPTDAFPLVLFWRTRFAFNSTPKQLRALAEVFSHATGWPLTETRD